jgi:hypothetical protein
MHMQITSSDKIHKLTPLKFEILDVATKTVNAIPSQYLLNVSGSFYLYVTAYSVYLDFLYLYFSECRWRGCLGRCVHFCMLLI